MTRDSKQAVAAGGWRACLLIVAASALAHLWCLRSVFYMDDSNAILNNPVVLHGGLSQAPLLAWTHFVYRLQALMAGMNPVAFHAVNWLLHTAVACVLFGFGRDFIRDKWPAGVALFGALLFAVHPLASEIPNYARTQDLAWVTLFSLLAAWAVLRFLRDGKWIWLAGCAVAVAGATISKGPGLFHAASAVAVVGLATMGPRHRQWLWRWKWALAAIAAAGLAVLGLTGNLSIWFQALQQWTQPRFIGHAFTVARVFWEFTWRAVLPVGLSSDHLITETLVPPGASWWNLPDRVALLAMVTFLGTGALTAWLAWKPATRLLGVCLFLFVATMLLRLLYLIPEFMPEYRIYPGLPWFCLGAALGLAWLWGKFSLPARVPAVLLLAVFALMSASRSQVWHSLDTLCADVLKRYPARARALWELSDRDLAAGNWQAIIDRQQHQWPAVEQAFVTTNQRLAPAREIPSGDFVLAMVALHGRYAVALAHTQGLPAALRVLAQLERHMQLMQMTEKSKPTEWGHFFHAKALVLESAGRLPEAVELLRGRTPNAAARADLERMEKRLAERPPAR